MKAPRLKFRKFDKANTRQEWFAGINKGRGISSGVQSRIGPFWFAFGLFFNRYAWQRYFKLKKN